MLLVVTAVALMTLDARSVGPFNGVREVAYTATQPFRAVIGFVLSPIGSAWNGAVHYDDLQAENAQLRRDLADLEGRVARLPEAERELEQLLEATEIDYVGDIPRVTARVVTDRDTNLERIIEIDRGSDDGCEVDMPIVTGSGLVGRIIAVEGGRSQVQLITDARLHVGVVTATDRATGVTSGAGNGNPLVVDLVDGAIDVVSTGTRFLTSGFDRSRYPGGIPVGRLRIDGDATLLEPIADLDNLGYLTVLLVPEPE
ncbi:MAG: rod shape-determining protein MreC [Acidimicrobiales bacterium]